MAATTKDLIDNEIVVSEKIDRSIYGGFDGLTQSLTSNLSYLTSEDRSSDARIRSLATTQLHSGEYKARAYRDIADLHFMNKRFSQAINPYIKSLKIDSKNLNAYERLIESLIELCRYDQADIFYNNLINATGEHPKYIASYIEFRLRYLSDDDNLADTEEIISTYLDSNEVSILNSLALYKLIINNNRYEAIRLLLKGLKIDSDNVDLNNNLAICYRMEKDYKNAEKYFFKAHYLDLKYLPAYENLASTFYIQAKYNEAISILENASTNGVTLSNDWMHNLAMIYFTTDNYDKSIQIYKRLLETDNDNNLILNNIGASMEKLGNIDGAVQYYIAAVKLVKDKYSAKISLDDRSCVALNNLINIYINKAQYSLAQKVIESAKKIFPYNNVAFHQNGLLDLNQGDYASATSNLKRSLHLNPNYIDSVINYSFILENIDFDYDEAIELLMNYIQVENPDQRNVIFNNLAYAFLKINDIDSAKEYIVDSDTTYASYATRGLLYLVQGKDKLSEKMYTKAFANADSTKLNITKLFYYFEHAEFYLNKQDYNQAYSFALKGLKYKNSNPKVYKRLKQIAYNIASMAQTAA